MATSDPLFERRYRAVAGRDRRFDGYFFTAVTTTGIYCRPSCPAKTPRRDRVRFFPTSAAAQGAGFRACKRCIPGASPGSPEWDLRGDVAGRAMRLIDEGLIEREGVPGLAARLGYGERQLRRILLADLGAGPLALARAQRAATARLLLQTTDLAVTEIAFSAGFASLRQCNATIREVYDATPTELRAAARRRAPPPGADPHAPTPGLTRLTLRLARRDPFDFGALLAFLGPRAIPGVEVVLADRYRRSLRLPGGPALVELVDDGDAVRADLALADPSDLAPAVARLRRLLDLDADPAAIVETLGADRDLGRFVRADPGRRAPGSVDPIELVVRAIAGQQVSVASATRIVGRIAGTLGRPLPGVAGDAAEDAERPTLLFPDAETLAEAPDEALPLPAARRGTVRAVASAIATGRLRLGAGVDREEARARLIEIPGIGPWTAGYVSLRALGDPDVLLVGDLGVRKAAEALGLPLDPAALAAHGARWAPWRSYATHHLWGSLGPNAALAPTATSKEPAR